MSAMLAISPSGNLLVGIEPGGVRVVEFGDRPSARRLDIPGVTQLAAFDDQIWLLVATEGNSVLERRTANGVRFGESWTHAGEPGVLHAAPLGPPTCILA